MDAYCSVCNRKVIEDDKDISFWTLEERENSRKYTCAFCSLGAEPNSTEAKVILGIYGSKYPLPETMMLD